MDHQAIIPSSPLLCLYALFTSHVQRQKQQQRQQATLPPTLLFLISMHPMRPRPRPQPAALLVAKTYLIGLSGVPHLFGFVLADSLGASGRAGHPQFTLSDPLNDDNYRHSIFESSKFHSIYSLHLPQARLGEYT
jgi:hypothetical protein